VTYFVGVWEKSLSFLGKFKEIGITYKKERDLG